MATTNNQITPSDTSRFGFELGMNPGIYIKIGEYSIYLFRNISMSFSRMRAYINKLFSKQNIQYIIYLISLSCLAYYMSKQKNIYMKYNNMINSMRYKPITTTPRPQFNYKSYANM